MEDRSPASPFAGKQQFTASSLVRNLTESMALRPDKLPWSNAPVVGRYGSNADEAPYSYYLSGGGPGDQQLPHHQTHVSPDRVLPPPPYYNVKQKMPCGCNGVVGGGGERDVTSCSFIYDDGDDKSTSSASFRPEVEAVQGQQQLVADLYGFDRKWRRRMRRGSSGGRWSRRRSSSALRLDVGTGSEFQREEEEDDEKQERVDWRLARPSRPASFPLDDAAKFRSYVTSSSADVTLVPTIVSDCYTSSSGVVGGVVVMATDSTPKEIP